MTGAPLFCSVPETLHVQLHWRRGAPADPRLRRRAAEEVRAISWSLSEMQAMLADAHQRTGLAHAYLLPRLELKLPIFDMGARWRIVLTRLDTERIVIVDEDGRAVADVRLL
jgi:hypothetical protein